MKKPIQKKNLETPHLSHPRDNYFAEKDTKLLKYIKIFFEIKTYQ